MELIDAQKKTRYVFLDYARVIAAFLVIYGHLYTPSPQNYVRVFIYQFHMAFFFFVSGMLHKYYGKINYEKYAKKILLPIVFFASIFFLMSGALYHNGFWGYKEAVSETIRGSNILFTYINYLKYSIIGILKGSAMLNGPCWFLIALFYCKIFADYLELKRIFGMILYVGSFVFLCVYVHKYFFVANCIMAMPFYYGGFKFKDRIFQLMKNGYRFLLIPICLFVVLLIMHYNGTVSMWSIKFGNLSKYISIPLFYVVGFSGSTFLLILSSYFPQRTPLLKQTADSLISILGMQIVFIFLVDNVFGFNLSYPISLLIAFCVMILCVFSHLIISKCFPLIIGLK